MLLTRLYRMYSFPDEIKSGEPGREVENLVLRTLTCLKPVFGMSISELRCRAAWDGNVRSEGLTGGDAWVHTWGARVGRLLPRRGPPWGRVAVRAVRAVRAACNPCSGDPRVC